MTTNIASVKGARGDILHVTQLGISKELGTGLQLTTDGKHGGDGHTTLHREAVVELSCALSTWLASGPSFAPPPERGEVIYTDGWIHWYWTKDRSLVVMHWVSGGLWVSYPPVVVLDLARRLQESADPSRAR